MHGARQKINAILVRAGKAWKMALPYIWNELNRKNKLKCAAHACKLLGETVRGPLVGWLCLDVIRRNLLPNTRFCSPRNDKLLRVFANVCGDSVGTVCEEFSMRHRFGGIHCLALTFFHMNSKCTCRTMVECTKVHLTADSNVVWRRRWRCHRNGIREIAHDYSIMHTDSKRPTITLVLTEKYFVSARRTVA